MRLNTCHLPSRGSWDRDAPFPARPRPLHFRLPKHHAGHAEGLLALETDPGLTAAAAHTGGEPRGAPGDGGGHSELAKLHGRRRAHRERKRPIYLRV